MNRIKVFYIIINCFLITSCVSFDSGEKKDGVIGLHANSGKYVSKLFLQQCQACQIDVEIEKTGSSKVEEWASILGVIISDKGQSSSVHVSLISYPEKKKHFSIIRVGSFGKEGNIVWLSETRINKVESFELSWRGSLLNVYHRGKTTNIDMKFLPYSFGYVASGASGNIYFSNSNLTPPGEDKVPVDIINHHAKSN